MLLGQERIEVWRQAFGDIRNSIASPATCIRFDLRDEHSPRSTVFERLGGVPIALDGVLDLVRQGAKVPPGQLFSRLLHKLRVRPGLGERAHVFQVARRETPHIRKGDLQVTCKLFDDAGSPSLATSTA